MAGREQWMDIKEKRYELRQLKRREIIQKI